MCADICPQDNFGHDGWWRIAWGCVVIIKFSKAFDTISHNILLNKLVDKGFPDNFIIWMKSYLTGRTQRVCVDNTQSTSRNITSGVPQGSIIGPVLFTFYIADIRDQYYMKYSDYMRLFHKISLDVQASSKPRKQTIPHCPQWLFSHSPQPLA